MKMKKLILVLVLSTMTTYGQKSKSTPQEDLEITTTLKFTQSKNTAYIDALIWIAESISDANEAIKLKDKDAGVIVVKGNQDFVVFNTYFTMTLRFKETECLITYKNFKETNNNYNTNGWGIEPNACYTKSCEKNYAIWFASLDGLVNRINSNLKTELQ